MEKVYRSKISVGIVLFLIIVFGSSYIPVFKDGLSWEGMLLFLLPVVFIIHLFMTIYYTIKDDTLIVKASFLIYEEIKIESIRKIKETRTLVASPATSLDRLAILFGSDMVIISPKEKAEFIAHIQRLNPN